MPLAEPTWGGILNGKAEGVLSVLALNGTDPVLIPVGPYMFIPIVAVMIFETGSTPGLELTGLHR